MAEALSSRLRAVWSATSRLDRLALFIALVYGVEWAVREPGVKNPLSGLLGFFFLLACIYGIFRIIALARQHLLWSLRNRLIVAYLFIAVVPILLLLTMAGLSTFIMYSQLGAYLLNRDVQASLAELNGNAEQVLAASPAGEMDYPRPAGMSVAANDPVSMIVAAQAVDFPGLEVKWNQGAELLPPAEPKPAKPGAERRFSGLYQEKDKIWLRSVVSREGPRGPRVVSLSVPLGLEFLERLSPQLGEIQLNVMQPFNPSDPQAVKNGFTYKLGDRTFHSVAVVSTRQRNLPPPAGWWDREVTGISRLEAAAIEEEGSNSMAVPVFATFSARPAQLSRHLFASLGDFGNLPFVVLLVIGGLFLIIEAGALYVGVRMTQSITGSVADLYRATERVRAQDFSYRIRIDRKDQLGELGDSFNAMTVSVASAIDEQRRRERLENELAIAHEVQAQLFPRELPRLPGLELAAVCRAARTVSGDFYDFIPLGKKELGIIVADIAGKGISAALLMASLQAALRSQLLESGSGMRSTADVVQCLNQHLLISSPDDRYATLFFSIYDSASRVLRYTNAGHLPPICFSPDGIRKLEEGGTVVGLFDDCEYEEGRVTIAPGTLLMAYTDGLKEPENAYGEEFGSKRLIAEVLRHRQARLSTIADAVVGAVEDWAGTPERSDDMTVVLASVT